MQNLFKIKLFTLALALTAVFTLSGFGLVEHSFVLRGNLQNVAKTDSVEVIENKNVFYTKSSLPVEKRDNPDKKDGLKKEKFTTSIVQLLAKTIKIITVKIVSIMTNLILSLIQIFIGNVL
ncbi:hypothetical protein SAMN04515674_11666 [Pseudarcicella hirudinis]|uniref:Uncharacterized protein n=1 Tax=Pseudarcicella hirudinis TaxID=1079859 RepID=A0A1I5XZL1_9BACT|nr:hypothetical protein [Pseudarcicella hirudinis]SFQ37375.1 hypothetical protein SAMN04515674_11666 [Pseudarcicella hirudinis]